MNFTYNRVDLAASERFHQARKASPNQPFLPFDTIQRVAGEDWFVPHSAISFDRPPDWRITKRDGHVYVPLVPYLFPSQPDLALGFMIQLAAACFGGMDKAIARLHIATGYPVNEVVDEEEVRPMWQYYVGFAVLLEKR